MADRSLLARATEGTIAPTPGYLYLDIAKNVATSPMACQEVATYLSRRLQSKQNPNIKYKCLKVIAKVAESPITRGMFKRTMAQDNQSMACIKEALQFRGPPDPARGDEPYQKVRTAAKEAMDAIYSDAPTSTSHAGDYSNPYGAPIGGHAGPSSTKPTSTRMEGIGNPMFKDPRTDPSNQPMTAETFLREAAEAVTGMIKDPLARNVDLGPPSGYGARPGGMTGYGGGGTVSARVQVQCCVFLRSATSHYHVSLAEPCNSTLPVVRSLHNPQVANGPWPATVGHRRSIHPLTFSKIQLTTSRSKPMIGLVRVHLVDNLAQVALVAPGEHLPLLVQRLLLTCPRI
jgi:hypothetical protein